MFLKIGRCKLADEHFFPAEEKHRCRQLNLCYTLPAGVQNIDAKSQPNLGANLCVEKVERYVGNVAV